MLFPKFKGKLSPPQKIFFSNLFRKCQTVARDNKIPIWDDGIVSILIGFWISRHIGRVENEEILKVKYVRNVYL